MIPLTRPQIGEEACAAALAVLRSGNLVQGAQCEAFEAELAQWLGAGEVVLCSSGTAALHLSLLALGIGPGDGVLVPDFTFPASANAVELCGARTVLVDVDAATYNITPALIDEAIAAYKGPQRLAAIMPVHEFGAPADMAGIGETAARHGLKLIEDAACALGTDCSSGKAGTLSDAGCFSFHPRKALTTGEGGAIAVKDAGLARTLRELRSHGMRREGGEVRFIAAGLNYRMTDFQAALGRAQLPLLQGWIAERRRLQGLYRELLADAPLTLPAQSDGHAWQTFMVLLPDCIERAGVIAALRQESIEANLGAQALHCQPYYRDKYPDDAARLAGGAAERLFRRGLALPLFAGMKDEEVEQVAGAVKKVLSC
jgi:perosamine synthetase